jgi:predicted HAD superfamily phosphohydrolase
MNDIFNNTIAESNCIPVENVLFLRREIKPGATLKAIIPLLTVIEIQNGLNLQRISEMRICEAILSESVNWN